MSKCDEMHVMSWQINKLLTLKPIQHLHVCTHTYSRDNGGMRIYGHARGRLIQFAITNIIPVI